MAHVPNADWSALDQRESGYTRQSMPNGTAIYEIKDAVIHPQSGPFPILLSYLDVVTQGYLREFGEDGALNFFATTDNWGPIKDDRHAPLYPRHQQLTAAETAFVDQQIRALSI
jgi:hypothetical protein